MYFGSINFRWQHYNDVTSHMRLMFNTYSNKYLSWVVKYINTKNLFYFADYIRTYIFFSNTKMCFT